MFDITLRPIKDRIFDPLSKIVPRTVSPHAITAIGFSCGLAACAFAAGGLSSLSVVFWLLNRALDCLDGSFARASDQQSDLGGFLDLLADFIVYSLIPICCALGNSYGDTRRTPTVLDYVWIMLLEAAFHINNFVLFFTAAVTEKAKVNSNPPDGKTFKKPGPDWVNVAKELTSVSMRPALIEGFESGIFFTLMLMFPAYLSILSPSMLVVVVVGTMQRTYWLAHVLR